MALTTQERERVRYHLGYLNVGMAGSIQFGLPRPIQTLFIVEEAMDQLLAVGEDRVRRTLNVLDGVECKLIDAQKYLVAESLGDLKIRDGHPDRLEKEYRRWAMRLADQLGVPLYAYSNRFSSGGAGNVPVSG
jgi:hypothetical protein